MALLMRGLRGEPVKRIQSKLGLDADGIFGPNTEKTLKEFQESKGLAADGIAGPDTFAALGLHELIILKRGSKGAMVKRVQEALGLDADGKYGPNTDKTVREYQEAKGLTVDGIVGRNTLASMGLDESSADDESNPWDDLDEQTAGTMDKINDFFSFS